MKIAIINDSHWGARNDSPIFLEHFLKFYEKVFFPYLSQNVITNVIHLGDLMDRRKYVNFQTLNTVRERFMNPLFEMGVQVDIVLGNHDVYYKNTNDVNSVRELFEFSNVCTNWRIHHKPGIIHKDIALVPWITKDNEKECLDFIASRPCPILMGHFELSGYEVLRGVEHHEGMDPNLLSKYEAVYSGHFHCKHSKGNVHYLGTQYQITFSDLNEPKGFHVLDTETREIEYIRNPYRIFTKLVYNDETTDYASQEVKLSDYANTFVKVVVEKKTKPVLFEQVLERLNEFGCHSYSVEDRVQQDKNKPEQKVDLTKDTLTLICEEIDSMSDSVPDSARLKNLVRDLYMEAIQS